MVLAPVMEMPVVFEPTHTCRAREHKQGAAEK
jgi:hypothetical protein